MANLTLSIHDALKLQMERYDEVRWSEVAKKAIQSKLLELRKLDLLRKYMDREQFNSEDLAWMDANDWHPVDERPMRKDFARKIKARMGRPGQRTTLDELLG